MRGRWLAIAITVVVMLGSTAPAATAHSVAKSGGSGLRVVSFNIQHGADSDGNLDLSRTARTIRRSGADVVGLEEVDKHWGDRSDGHDQPSRLAHMLGMHVSFAHIYDLDPSEGSAPRREYGVAILSRYPITRATNHSITRLSTQGDDPQPEKAPGFGEAVIDVDGTPVHVYATHLDFRADPSVRKKQVSETQDILARDGNDARQVLMGDFNAPPDAPELEPLWDHLHDMGADGGELTFPADHPVKRIDYVAVSANMTAGVRTRVPKTRASDHRPVVAQLRVQPKEDRSR